MVPISTSATRIYEYTPSDATRIANLKALIPEARALGAKVE
jgi:hypothetical protein